MWFSKQGQNNEQRRQRETQASTFKFPDRKDNLLVCEVNGSAGFECHLFTPANLCHPFLVTLTLLAVAYHILPATRLQDKPQNLRHHRQPGNRTCILPSLQILRCDDDVVLASFKECAILLIGFLN